MDMTEQHPRNENWIPENLLVLLRQLNSRIVDLETEVNNLKRELYILKMQYSALKHETKVLKWEYDNK
jgi:hypothetical protein